MPNDCARWFLLADVRILASVLASSLAPAQQPIVVDPSASFHRTVAVGDVVHVFSHDLNGPGGFLHHNRSFDAGRTWLATPTTLLGNVTRVVDAVGEGDHLVVSVERVNGPVLLRSDDGGLSWYPPSTIHTSPPGTSGAALKLVQGVLLAAWAEPRVGPGDIYVNRSLDHGATWSSVDTRLDVGIADLPSRVLRILGDSRAIYVAYYEEAAPSQFGGAWLNSSVDLGVTWGGQARSYSTTNSGIAVSGNVVLADDNGGRRSVDHGVTWAATGHASNTVFAMDGQLAIAAERSPSFQVVPSVSLDTGATWAPRPPIPFPNITHVMPWVAGDAAGFAIGYWGACCFLTNAACYRSLDRGGNWTAFPQWLSGVSVAWNTWQSVPLEDGLLHVFGRGYPAPIVAQFDHGFQPYGVSTAGTGAFEPLLRCSGAPTIGNTVILSMSEARGGSVAAFACSFAGPANQPLGNATILLAQPSSTNVFVTTGAPGTPGIGTGALPIPIPNDQTFLGLRAWLQGFVLDPASGIGVSATAGIEMVVR